MRDYGVVSHNARCYQNSMCPVRREDQQVSSQDRALVGGAWSPQQGLARAVRRRSGDQEPGLRFMVMGQDAVLSPLPRTHCTLLLLHTEFIGAHFCLSVYYNIHRRVYKMYLYLYVMNCILDNHR